MKPGVWGLPCFCMGWLRWLLPGYIGVLKGAPSRKRQSSVYSPYSITNLERASLPRLRPVVYLSSAFYTQSKPIPALSVKATYTPPLTFLELRKLYFPPNCTGYYSALLIIEPHPSLRKLVHLSRWLIYQTFMQIVYNVE